MIVIDVEIKKAIPPRGSEEPQPDVEYCKGWRDFAGMGIACVCTFELPTGLSRTFLEEDLDELDAYLNGRATAGFNTRRFDLLLLAEHGVKPSGFHYDILEQVWVAQGLDPDRFVPATHGGWSLDAICEATLHTKKSGNGAFAPIWWQQGKRGRVIDYCLRDVWLEASLLRHILEHRFVLRSDRRLDLPLSSDVLEACR